MTAGNDTCSMILTPFASGAISVVRVTGPDAPDIVKHLMGGDAASSDRGASRSSASPSRVPASPRPLVPQRLCLTKFVHDGELIDEGIISLRQTPGRNQVDVCVHGGVRVVERLVESLGELGAPLRSNGPVAHEVWPVSCELEGEIIDAMAQAATERAVRFLSWQFGSLPSALRRAAACCKAGAADETREQLAGMLDGASAARRLVRGSTIALIGPPNSGKSTLFNRLAGRCVSVVSERAGTTRDWVSQSIEINGFPVTLLDTAGDRDTWDELERQAITAGSRAAQQADVLVLVLDAANAEKSLAESSLSSSWRADRPRVVVWNKIDLCAPSRPAKVNALPLPMNSEPPVELSALTGEGVERLIDGLSRWLGHEQLLPDTPTFFTDRQVVLASDILNRAAERPTEAAETIESHLWGRLGGSRRATMGRGEYGTSTSKGQAGVKNAAADEGARPRN